MTKRPNRSDRARARRGIVWPLLALLVALIATVLRIPAAQAVDDGAPTAYRQKAVHADRSWMEIAI